MSRSGVCVGGPYAGRYIQSSEGAREVAFSLLLSPDEIEPTAKTIQHFTYFWNNTFGPVGFWLWQEFGRGETHLMEAIMKELLSNYRPLA